MTLFLSGILPDHWGEALDILADDLGFAFDDSGIPVRCSQGSGLAVVSDGRSVRITWQTPVQLYRALSLIPVPLAPCDIHEKACFQQAGPMFDCSRNAVAKPETLRFFLRKMALMGLNLAMLYTEDTYQVPELPYFGYKRGSYSVEELKALDDYADTLGIELCPCIQTLGHLDRVLHWPAMQRLQDNGSVILADLDESYEALEQMIRAASAPFHSKRIHIGMDEAYGVGLGQHLRRFGYEDPCAIMGRHLSRVLEITDRLGLCAMIWSDMYFHLDGQGYYDGAMPTQKAIDAVDPRVTLVYWDYYHDQETDYTRSLARHARFPVPTVFAGGLWTWAGIAPSYTDAIGCSLAGLEACRKAGIPLVLATLWGDDGAECPAAAAMLGLQLYGEFTCTGRCDEATLSARFRRCCGADAQAFLDLELLNALPGLHGRPGNPINACKILLYQDPLVQLFEQDLLGIAAEEHFAPLAAKYEQAALDNPGYALLFRFYAALAETLTLKCSWHRQAAPAVRNGDPDAAARLADSIPAMAEAVERLRSLWRQLWEHYNKPYGFEIIDARLGGIRARLLTAGDKMAAFAAGDITDIPELTGQTLLYMRQGDVLRNTNTIQAIFSPATLDFI